MIRAAVFITDDELRCLLTQLEAGDCYERDSQREPDPPPIECGPLHAKIIKELAAGNRVVIDPDRIACGKQKKKG